MKTIIEIKMDNAAFEESNSEELARILARLAQRLEGAQPREIGDGEYLFDINGNKIGHWEIVES